MGIRDFNIRKLGVFKLSLLILLLALGGWIAHRYFDAYGYPFKITDPSHPRFNPDRFSFGDYDGRDELIVAYKKLFPIGTPKEFVDRVLVEAGEASCGPSQTYPQLWHCRQPLTMRHWDVGPVFLLIFDKNMKLLNIDPNGLGEIYPNSVTGRDLREQYLVKRKQTDE